MKRILFLSLLAWGFQSCAAAASSTPIFTMCEANNKPENYVHSWITKPLIGLEGKYLFQTDPHVPQWKNAIDDDTLKRLKRLNNAFKSRGINLISIVQPAREDLYAIQKNFPAKDDNIKRYNDFINKEISAGIITPNILKYLIDSKVSFDDYYFMRDHHWNANGAKITAEIVANEIKRLSAYRNLEKQAYSLESIKANWPGSLAINLEKACNIKIPAEIFTTYKAHEKQTSLLGDTPKADVVILGTSNSETARLGFADTLAYSLGAPVLNYAISGSDTYDSLENYLQTKDYKNSPPKVIVWEAPITYPRNRPEFLRRVLPAVYGECAKPLDAGKISKGGVVVKNGPNGNNGYIYLDFKDSTIKQFSVNLEYSNNFKETVNINQSARLSTSGKFFLDLNEKGTILNKISIEGTSLAADFKVCKY